MSNAEDDYGWGRESDFARPQRGAKPASSNPLKKNPITRIGTHGARWHCTCGASLGTFAKNVDVHCNCGKIWRKSDRVIVPLRRGREG